MSIIFLLLGILICFSVSSFIKSGILKVVLTKIETEDLNFKKIFKNIFLVNMAVLIVAGMFYYFYKIGIINISPKSIKSSNYYFLLLFLLADFFIAQIMINKKVKHKLLVSLLFAIIANIICSYFLFFIILMLSFAIDILYWEGLV